MNCYKFNNNYYGGIFHDNKNDTIHDIRRFRYNMSIYQNLFKTMFNGCMDFCESVTKNTNDNYIKKSTGFYLYIESNNEISDNIYFKPQKNDFFEKMLKIINNNISLVINSNDNENLINIIYEKLNNLINNVEIMNLLYLGKSNNNLFMLFPKIEDYYNYSKSKYFINEPNNISSKYTDYIIDIVKKYNYQYINDKLKKNKKFVNNVYNRINNQFNKLVNTNKDTSGFYLFVWKIKNNKLKKYSSFRKLDLEFIDNYSTIKPFLNKHIMKKHNIHFKDNIIYYIKYPNWFSYTDFVIVIDYISPYSTEKKEIYKNFRQIILDDVIRNIKLNKNYYKNYTLCFFQKPIHIPVISQIHIINIAFDTLFNILHNKTQNDINKLYQSLKKFHNKISQNYNKYKSSYTKNISNVIKSSICKTDEYKYLVLNILICKELFIKYISLENNQKYNNNNCINDKLLFINKIIKIIKPYAYFIETIKNDIMKKNISDLYDYMINNKYKYICLEKNMEIIIKSVVYIGNCTTSLTNTYNKYPKYDDINDIVEKIYSNASNYNNLRIFETVNDICEYNYKDKKDTKHEKYKLFMKEFSDKNKELLIIKDYILYTIYKNTYDNTTNINIKFLKKKIYNISTKIKLYVEDYLYDSGFTILVKKNDYINNVINRIHIDPYLAFTLHDWVYKNKYNKINNVLNLLLLKDYTIVSITHNFELSTKTTFYGYFGNNYNDIYEVILNVNQLVSIDHHLFIDYMENYNSENIIGKTYKYNTNILLKNILLYSCKIEYILTLKNENIDNNIDKYIRYALNTVKIAQKDYIYTKKMERYYDKYINDTIEDFLLEINSIVQDKSTIVKQEYRYLNNPKYAKSYSLCTKNFIIFPDLKWSDLIEKNIIHKYEYINYKLIKAKTVYSNPYFVAFYMNDSLIKNSNLCNNIKGTNEEINIDYNIKKGNNYPHNIKFINNKYLNIMMELYVKTFIFLYEHHNLTCGDVHSYVHYQPFLNYGTIHVHFQSLYKKHMYKYVPLLGMLESDTLDKILRSIKLTDIIKNLSLDTNYYKKYKGISLSCFRPYQFMDMINN